jgi:hypothetical protein
MAYVNYAVTVVSGKAANLLDAPASTGAPDRASVAPLTFQQIDVQADNFNTAPIVVSSEPGGPGITLGPGGVGRLTLGPFGSTPLRLVDLWGTGAGVLRITGVTGFSGAAVTAAGDQPGPHHATHEPGGTDAIVALDGAVLTAGTVADARLSSNVPLKNAANLFTPVQAFQAGLIERGRPVPLGEWISVPFNAANFFGSGAMTWTVTAGAVAVFQYTLIGRTAIVAFYVGPTTIGGTSDTYLQVTLPVVATKTQVVPIIYNNAGSPWTAGYAQINAGQNNLAFIRQGSTVWALDSNAYIGCQISISV